MILSENIKHLRKAKGISQQNLADALSIPRSRIAAYESKNVEPRLHTLIALAEYFKISLDSLIKKDHRTSDREVDETNHDEIKAKCDRLEWLLHNRSQRLEFLWQEQEKVNPALQTAISELQAFHLLSKQALQLCRLAINE